MNYWKLERERYRIWPWRCDVVWWLKQMSFTPLWAAVSSTKLPPTHTSQIQPETQTQKVCPYTGKLYVWCTVRTHWVSGASESVHRSESELCNKLWVVYFGWTGWNLICEKGATVDSMGTVHLFNHHLHIMNLQTLLCCFYRNVVNIVIVH